MASTWFDIATDLPGDGDTVWIRRLMVEVPYQATWDATVSAFIMPNGLYLDWQLVSRWKPI